MKNNKPLKKGIAKTPVIMQMEMLECGAASLCMIFAYYGKWIPLEKVRIDCGVSRNGANAASILDVAEHYGMEVHAYSFDIDKLKEEATFPCIIHWEFSHFVVLNGIKGNKVYINDPAKGSVVMPIEKFDKSFTGVTLLFKPTDKFVADGKEKNPLDFIIKRFKRSKSMILFMTLLSVTISFFTLTSPLFQKIFLDKMLITNDAMLRKDFFFIITIFAIVYSIVLVVKGISDYRIMGKLAITNNVNFIWKLLNLPLDFFSQRMTGDLLNRQSANENISSTIVKDLVPLFFNILLMLVCFIVMVRYNIWLAIIAFLGLFLSVLLSIFVSNKRKNTTRVLMVDSAKYYSSVVAGINQMETIKANGAENVYFSKVAGQQAKTVVANQILLNISEIFTIVMQFIFTIFNQFILILGVYFCIKSQFSIGLLLAFTSMFQMLMNPTLDIISSGQEINEMKVQMERIDDVMEYPEDKTFMDDDSVDENVEYRKLTGNIEVKNLTFGYSRLEKPLIEDFSLKLKSGDSVAIVGGSGSGKSTIAKLISGLYKPWSGEILFDNKRLNEIPKNVFSSSLAVVDQDISLFADTIENNIKMWDTSIEDFEVILAARDAHIHDDILKRPEGYQYKLTEGGKNFSGGQRQRLEIARMLVQDPMIVILDEATSALDTKTEYEVVKSIRERGITCIVVAHRLSTIRDCGEIIVLDDGKVADRGTHSELFERCARYKELVLNE